MVLWQSGCKRDCFSLCFGMQSSESEACKLKTPGMRPATLLRNAARLAV